MYQEVGERHTHKQKQFVASLADISLSQLPFGWHTNKMCEEGKNVLTLRDFSLNVGTKRSFYIVKLSASE